MTLDQARAIIADSSLAPHMADWMLAGKILRDHWQRNPHLLKPANLRTGTRLTRDAANPAWEGTQQTSIGRSDPTVGGKRIMKLPGDATSYFIQSAPDGCWVVEAGDLDGMGDNGRGIPSGKPTGDNVVARHQRATAQRNAGAQFAAQFNAAQRAKWGQAH